MKAPTVSQSHDYSSLSDDLKKRVYDIIHTLEGFKEKLEKLHYTKDEKEFFHEMSELWNYFTKYEDAEAYEVFAHTAEFVKLGKFFKEKNLYFERALDTAEAVNIIANNKEQDIMDLLGYQFSANVLISAADEMKEIDTENIETLVMVGCGSMPETVISIAENYKHIKKIIAVDMDPEAVFIAGRLIQKIGLSDRIKIFHAKGEEFDYSIADCIHMANFLQKKKEILDRVSETAKKGCQVITRKTRYLSNMIYEDIYPELHSQLFIEKDEKSVNSFYVLEKFAL